MIKRGMLKRVIPKLSVLVVAVLLVSMVISVLPVAAAPAQSVAGTTTVTTSFNFPQQHRNFYAAGRHWEFWENGTHLVYDTSLDGVTWTGTPITVGDVRYHDATFFDLVIDASGNLHYAMSTDATHLYYRMGAPQADGSITWAQAQQTAAAVSVLDSCSIGIDSAGHVFIAYDLSGDSKGYVIRNDNTNGTWSTTAGFPYKISDTTGYSHFVCAAVGADMLVLYSKAPSVIYAQLYTTGVGWGVEETATTSTSLDWSVTTLGTTVYVALRTGGAGTDTRYVARTAGTWGAEAVISTLQRNVSVVADATNNIILFFYLSAEAGAGNVYYKKLSGGVLDTNPTTWVTTAAALQAGSITAYPYMLNGVISFGWAENGAPKNINYAYLGLPTITTSAATLVAMDKDGVTSGVFNANLTSQGNAASNDTWISYGAAAPAYGTNTSKVAKNATGAFTVNIPAGLTPGNTYHWTSNVDGRATGVDRTLVFTMPTHATATATNIGYTGFTTKADLRGTISNMGVATSTYYYWTWGYSSASLTNTTTTRTAIVAGTYSETITGFDPTKDVYYAFHVRNGATTNTTAATYFTPASSGGSAASISFLWLILPVVCAIGAIYWGIKAGDWRFIIMAVIAGIVALAVTKAILGM